MNSTKLPPAGIKSGGKAISADEIAAAVVHHAKATGIRKDVIQAMVDQGELVPVEWPEGSVGLFFNSPNGL